MPPNRLERSPDDYPIWAITGGPGSGKTSLAHRLSAAFDRPVISTGDLARKIDPTAIGRGELAHDEWMRLALLDELRGYGFGAGSPGFTPIILEGWPRSEAQIAWLPEDSACLFYLWCRPDVALDRLARRGRGDDDEKRIEEQVAEMEVWARKRIPYHRQLNTTGRSQQHIENTFTLYLTGQRGEVF